MDDIIFALVDFLLDIADMKAMDLDQRGQEIAKKLVWGFLWLFLTAVAGIVWLLER